MTTRAKERDRVVLHIMLAAMRLERKLRDVRDWLDWCYEDAYAKATSLSDLEGYLQAFDEQAAGGKGRTIKDVIKAAAELRLSVEAFQSVNEETTDGQGH